MWHKFVVKKCFLGGKHQKNALQQGKNEKAVDCVKKFFTDSKMDTIKRHFQ